MKVGIWFKSRAGGREWVKVAAKARVSMRWLLLKLRVGIYGFIIHFINCCILKFPIIK